jgi:UDP-glucose 4-epimerase
VDRATGGAIQRRIVPRRAGDPDSLISDISRITAQLPWVPRFANIDTIVGHALAWERKLGEIRAAA